MFSDGLILLKEGAVPITPAVIKSAFHLQASKYFQLASAIMLFYDELLTIGQEVERIWLQPWTGATLLFALIRYISLLSRPIVLVAFFSPAWTKDLYVLLPICPLFSTIKNGRAACNRFVKFSGASTVVIVGLAQIIMILRVWALWRKDKRILYILGFFFIVQVAFVGMALVYSKRVPLPPFLVGCILTGSSNLHTPTWLMPLFTDTAIFALTILRVIRYSKEAKLEPGSVLRTLVRDGALYYFCVFSANLLNTLLYIFATEDLKAIGAGFSQTLTTVVITRLILNLRSMNKCSAANETYPYSGHLTHVQAQKMTRLDFVIGSLGDAPNYDDDDCDGTGTQTSDNRTIVGSTRFGRDSDLKKISNNPPTPSSVARNSPVDLYRYSYRMVQHPYGQRTSYTSRYVDNAQTPAIHF